MPEHQGADFIISDLIRRDSRLDQRLLGVRDLLSLSFAAKGRRPPSARGMIVHFLPAAPTPDGTATRKPIGNAPRGIVEGTAKRFRHARGLTFRARNGSVRPCDCPRALRARTLRLRGNHLVLAGPAFLPDFEVENDARKRGHFF
jgi:hypothetical protein